MPIYRGSGGSGDASTDAYASQVATYANTATIKANEASASASAAATSATNAANSEATVAADAAAAATSASQAATSATQSASSATASAASATSSATSEDIPIRQRASILPWSWTSLMLSVRTCIGMKIATWNVNSIRSRLERILRWLEKTGPDVICLQELRVTEDGQALHRRRDRSRRTKGAETFGPRSSDRDTRNMTGSLLRSQS